MRCALESEISVYWLLLLQLALILVNAVFACAEIAVISINDSKLERMAAEGDRRAQRLNKLMAQPARFLATIQVGITLAGFWAAPLPPIIFPTMWWRGFRLWAWGFLLLP